MSLITSEGVKIFGRLFLFWIIPIILFLIIIVKNIVFLKNKIKRSLIFLKNKICSICTIVWKKLKKFIKNFFERNRDENAKINLSKRLFLMAFILMSSIFLSLLIFTSIEIYKLFEGVISANILACIFFLVMFIIFIWAITLQTNHSYREIILFLTLLTGTIFFLVKTQNLLLKSSLIGVFTILIIYFLFHKSENENYSLWLIATLTLMIVITSLGFMMLYDSHQNKEINLQLNIDGDPYKRYGEYLNCSNIDSRISRIKSGDTIYCEITGNQEIINYTIKLSKNNSFDYTGEKTIKINLPLEETQSFYFEGFVEKEGEIIFISTYSNYKILNENSWKEKDQMFAKNLYYLLTAVFFSIPLMAVNLRKLSKIKR